jgi:hypothetical protein
VKFTAEDGTVTFGNYEASLLKPRRTDRGEKKKNQPAPQEN